MARQILIFSTSAQNEFILVFLELRKTFHIFDFRALYYYQNKTFSIAIENNHIYTLNAFNIIN